MSGSCSEYSSLIKPRHSDLGSDYESWDSVSKCNNAQPEKGIELSSISWYFYERTKLFELSIFHFRFHALEIHIMNVEIQLSKWVQYLLCMFHFALLEHAPVAVAVVSFFLLAYNMILFAELTTF